MVSPSIFYAGYLLDGIPRDCDFNREIAISPVFWGDPVMFGFPGCVGRCAVAGEHITNQFGSPQV